MSKRLCQKCGCRIANHNPRVKLCSECNPRAAWRRDALIQERNEYFRQREETYENHKRVDHL